MNRTIFFGKIGGLTLSARSNVFIGFALLWVILAGIGIWLLGLTTVDGIIGGFIAAFLQYFAEYLHQLGHARAARRSGYPMIGIRFWWVLGMSIYPRDEGELPASIHIRRALGGPIFSFVLGLISVPIAWLLRNSPAVVFTLAVLFATLNIVEFTFGSLLPLGFTDGSTLLRYWPHRHDPE